MTDTPTTLVVYTTPEAAKDAMRAAAVTETNDDGTPGRTLVHAMAGFIGADWTLDGALAYVDKAVETDGQVQVAWVRDLFGHDLYVLADDNGRARLISFQVAAPPGTFQP